MQAPLPCCRPTCPCSRGAAATPCKLLAQPGQPPYELCADQMSCCPCRATWPCSRWGSRRSGSSWKTSLLWQGGISSRARFPQPSPARHDQLHACDMSKLSPLHMVLAACMCCSRPFSAGSPSAARLCAKLAVCVSCHRRVQPPHQSAQAAIAFHACMRVAATLAAGLCSKILQPAPARLAYSMSYACTAAS